MLWCSVFIPLMQLCFFSPLHVGLECLGTYHWLYTAFLRGVVGYIDFSMNLKSTTKCRTWVMRDFSQSLLGFTTVFLFLKPLMFSVWFYLFGDFYFGFIPTLSIYLRPVYWLFTDLLLITSNVGDLTLLAFDHKHNFWLFLCIFPFFCFALHSETCRGLTWHIRLHSIMSSGLPWDAEKNITTDRLRRKIQRLTERAVHIFMLTESQL